MVTDCSCDGTVSSQGVMHVWPWAVWTSAPSGSDSNFNAWSCSDEEFDDSAEEQPVKFLPVSDEHRAAVISGPASFAKTF